MPHLLRSHYGLDSLLVEALKHPLAAMLLPCLAHKVPSRCKFCACTASLEEAPFLDVLGTLRA